MLVVHIEIVEARRCTDRTITSDFDGEITTYPIDVLGKGEHSVVIRIHREPSPLDAHVSEFVVIQFDGTDAYWVHTMGGRLEYFKRVR